MDRQTSTIEELDKIEQFFAELDKPPNLNSIKEKISNFCERNANLKFVLVTVIRLLASL